MKRAFSLGFSLIPSIILAQPVFAQNGINTPCDSNTCNTAIGQVPVSNFGAFATFLLKWGLGVAGGISLLFILYSVFLITTSAGDPKKLQSGQEQLTSAIEGLLLIIFSVFLLQLIGVHILAIPGFS